VADTVVLQAVVSFTIAALADCVFQAAQLILPCLLRILPLIVLAVFALADLGVASCAPLETYAVKLSTLASLAVAPAVPLLALQIELGGVLADLTTHIRQLR